MSQKQSDTSTIELPDAPLPIQHLPVRAWEQDVEIDTYIPIEPEPFPMFFENRVYQGSSGKVYPLQFFNRISKNKIPKNWRALHLENSYVRLMILPQLGGRIHIGLDKTNNYDFLYRNNVIKPALVGLAGPWISGGIEFNWPQHHRPGTYNQVDFDFEEHDDGSRTVWCSDRDPFNRLSESHGITLHPDSSRIEIKVRLGNPTELRQTFLWWANMAVSANENYQSFFPSDVKIVADHARRAITGFPHATEKYYGIDYKSLVTKENPNADRLDWFKNIPVPTSYMCLDSKGDYFGGYDHGVEGGLVHWADHRISPGKKQWTWGNSKFGKAWDRNLTDDDGPYIELMAGVFTDNQPDFSYLEPGETKSFSQFIYPIQKIGAPKFANLDFAVNLTHLLPTNVIRIGVASNRKAILTVRLIDSQNNYVWDSTFQISPGNSLLEDIALEQGIDPSNLGLLLFENENEVLSYQPEKGSLRKNEFKTASVPAAPRDIQTVEELHLTALHITQYRHATRDPLPYWMEALRRDSFHTDSLIAVSQLEYRLGNFAATKDLLHKALERLTILNPNPISGEAQYLLGLTYCQLNEDQMAFENFAKSAWDSKFAASSYYEMAKLKCKSHEYEKALTFIKSAMNLNTNFSSSICLNALILRSLGLIRQYEEILLKMKSDGISDWYTRYISGAELTCDLRTKIDIANELASAGFFDDALKVLEFPENLDSEYSNSGIHLLTQYYRAWIAKEMNNISLESEFLEKVGGFNKDRAFPHGLGDLKVLLSALSTNPRDPKAHAIVGNLYYSTRQYDSSIFHWEEALKIEPNDAISHRNLAIALYNIKDQIDNCISHYEDAVLSCPESSLLVFERDQLAKRMGEPVLNRLKNLQSKSEKIHQRDDLTIEYISLLLANSSKDKALLEISGRHFQPWEGGEGQALKLWERINLHLSRDRTLEGNFADAAKLLENALTPPLSLGEDHHPLANRSEIYLSLGDTLRMLGDEDGSTQAWSVAAYSRGDFQNMAPRSISDKTFYSIEAFDRLGLTMEREEMVAELCQYAENILGASIEIDYFATSLPRLLLFKDDPLSNQKIEYKKITAQIEFLNDNANNAITSLTEILQKDPSNDIVFDLLIYMRSHLSRSSK